MTRVRMYDAKDAAKELRERFTAKPATKRRVHKWDWPSRLQWIGESHAVAYESDKWKEDGEFELYKHLAESKNNVYAVPKFLKDESGKPWPTIGPMVTLPAYMPDHFAELALFTEADVQLFTSGTDTRPRLDRGDDGFVAIEVSGGILGAGHYRMSASGESTPFLFVFTNGSGPELFITGDKLDIEADGIVG